MVKKMNVLYIVDQDHERSVNVVDRSITVKDIKWIVYTTYGQDTEIGATLISSFSKRCEEVIV